MLKIKEECLDRLKEFGFERSDRAVFFSDMFHGWHIVIKNDRNEVSIAVHDKASEVGEYRQICCAGVDKFPMFGHGLVAFDETLKFIYKLIKADMIEEIEE